MDFLLDERVKINNLQNKEIFENNKITSHFDVTVNMTDNEWHEMISIHLNGTFFCTREALKIMNEQTQGCIINMPRNPEYSDLSCSSCLESSFKAAILGYPATAEVGKSTFISCMVEALVVPLKPVFRCWIFPAEIVSISLVIKELHKGLRFS